MKRLITHPSKDFLKTITFTGASGLGLVNVAVPVATITGRVLLREMTFFCSTLLAGVSGTVSLGTANNVGGIIPVTTATAIDTNEFWRDDSPESQISSAIKNRVISANLIIDVLTATITGGVLQVAIKWSPLSINSNLA